MWSVLSQLFKFMKVYRKFWLAPIILGLLSEEMVCFYNPISSVGTSGVNNLLGSHT